MAKYESGIFASKQKMPHSKFSRTRVSKKPLLTKGFQKHLHSSRLLSLCEYAKGSQMKGKIFYERHVSAGRLCVLHTSRPNNQLYKHGFTVVISVYWKPWMNKDIPKWLTIPQTHGDLCREAKLKLTTDEKSAKK